mgnify:FL=1
MPCADESGFVSKAAVPTDEYETGELGASA